MVPLCCSCPCGDYPNDHDDSRNLTLLDLRCAAEASGISLSEVAANITKAVAMLVSPIEKSGRSDAMGMVVKADDEKRYLLTVAYPAFKPDIGLAADGFRDAASDEVVERACWNFMRKGCELGLYHEEGHDPIGVGEVVENYVYRADPWVIKSPSGPEQIIMPGDWLVGAVLSPKTWGLYKSGLINSASVEGRASRRTPSAEFLARLRS